MNTDVVKFFNQEFISHISSVRNFTRTQDKYFKWISSFQEYLLFNLINCNDFYRNKKIFLQKISPKASIAWKCFYIIFCALLLKMRQNNKVFCLGWGLMEIWQIKYESILSFAGNLMVILVMTLHRRMASYTNFFLTNLAFADLCVSIFCIYQNFAMYVINE